MPTSTALVHPETKHRHKDTEERRHSAITKLRALMPRQPVTREHSAQVVRQQATALLRDKRSADITPIELITDQPRVRIEYSFDQQIPRASFWDIRARQWVIQLRWSDSWKHHRFNIAHEFKHILDHGFEPLLYPSQSASCAACQAERAADYFARHFLVPGHRLRRALRAGLTSISDLADHFAVPETVIHERLHDLRVSEDATKRRAGAKHRHRHIDQMPAICETAGSAS